MGDVVLAHGEDRPDFAIAKQVTQLLEERLLDVAVDDVDGEHLFELVEEQAEFAAVGITRRDPVEIFGETVRRQLVGRQPCAADRIGFLQRHQHAEHVAVCRADSRFVTNANRR